MDIRMLVSDAARAEFLFDAQGDPEGALRTLQDGIEEYVTVTGAEKLPEDLCGPVMGTVGAVMVAALREGFTGPDGEWGGTPEELFIKGMMAAQTVEHAALDHGDPLALAIRYPHGDPEPSLSDSYDAIVEWVSEVLWDLSDIDPDLLLIGEDFDGPDAA